MKRLPTCVYVGRFVAVWQGLEGHIFVNPVDPESYFGMAVFKNGGVVRERLRDAYCESISQTQQEQQSTSSSNKTLDRWEMFAAALEQVSVEKHSMLRMIERRSERSFDLRTILERRPR
eukprot:COSAG06_NODE_7825_length_2363_cov_2.031802_2_plen_119_part_00